MDITPHDYGEPWRLVQTEKRSDLVLRDGTPFRGNNPLEEKAQPRTISCVNAFAGVSDRLLDKLAEAAKDRTAELRMLLLALVADPLDKVNMAALRDYLDENLGRPESVLVNGAEVPVHKRLHVRWWGEQLGMQAARGIYRAVFLYGRLNRDRTFQAAWSIADLQNLSLKYTNGIGPSFARTIRTFLKSVGLEPTE